MHESMMTPDEASELDYQILAFFTKRKGIDVALGEAEAHLVALGHTLTRPVEDTLRAHGVLQRDEAGSTWTRPLQTDAWRLDGQWLRGESGCGMNAYITLEAEGAQRHSGMSQGADVELPAKVLVRVTTAGRHFHVRIDVDAKGEVTVRKPAIVTRTADSRKGDGT